MKTSIYTLFLLILTITFLFTGCLPTVSEEKLQKFEEAKQADQGTIIDQALAEHEATEDSPPLVLEQMPQQKPSGQPDPTVDIDLTVMSSIMIYSEVYNIVVDPDSYVGKSIKLQGFFQTYENPQLQKNNYFVIVPDATACCEQGLEILVGDGSTPYEYPKELSTVEIKGVFEKYEEADNTFYRIITEEVVNV